MSASVHHLLGALLVLASGTELAKTADLPWSARVWRAESLPEPTVTSLTQTSDRFIWFASPRFLVRFDGVAFEPLDRAALAPDLSQPIRLVLGTRDGALWAAASQRSGFVCGATGRRCLPITCRRARRTALLKMAKERFGSVTRMVRPAGSGQEPQRDFRRRTFRRTEPRARSPATGPARFGSLEADGREFLPGDDFSRGIVSDLMPAGRIRTIVEDATGKIWMASDGVPLLRLDNGVAEIATDALRGRTALALCAGSDGGMWMTFADGGVGRIKDDRTAVVGVQQGLPEGFPLRK